MPEEPRIRCGTCYRKKKHGEFECSVLKDCLWKANYRGQPVRGSGNAYYNFWEPDPRAKLPAFKLVSEPHKPMEVKIMRLVPTGKTLRVMDVVNSETPSDDEKANFLSRMQSEFNYIYTDAINIDDKFLSYAGRHDCFMQWLEKEGYITSKKVFEPFKLELQIETLDELLSIYHRFNAGHGYFEKYKEQTMGIVPFPKNRDGKDYVKPISRLWKEIDNCCKEIL